jgi:hypothetical protein
MNGKKEGRKEDAGRKERQKEERTDGWMNGKKEGRKEKQ